MTVTQQEEWNFDEIIDRKGTKAIKWSPKFMEMLFGTGDLLPLWVADMDFRAPQVLIDKLSQRVDHGIFGYTVAGESYSQAVIDWFQRRHNWSIEKDWMIFSPGIVPAINFLIQTFTHPGDKVIIQEPVYYPFASVIRNNGRFVLNNELLLKDDHYQIDFADLKKQCETPRAKMLILCSPHNPVARVWTQEELTELGKICLKNDILVVSDEIHCDLIFPGHEHIPFARINEDFQQNSIICTAPSKTFNIAGLKASNIIIPNEQLRKEFAQTMANVSIRGPTIFGGLALETVYNECEAWLDSLLVYIQENFQFLKEFVEKHLPGVKVLDLEGTYLAWVDFRGLGLNAEKLDEIMKKEAKVGLDDGAMFGESGKGFQRFNLACPKAILKEALERIQEAFKEYLK
ncbi:MAG: putative C-S lyase [Candidatus Heimdallarchaeota archaeon]|nr:putative C-S lyase [Candidatus Heimdallarchaeota archaeon]